jgi:hypothetical protein
MTLSPDSTQNCAMRQPAEKSPFIVPLERPMVQMIAVA